MWIIDLDIEVENLTPAEQLWIIALAVKENGGPKGFVVALRGIAERLEEIGWWTSESTLPEVVRQSAVKSGQSQLEVCRKL